MRARRNMLVSHADPSKKDTYTIFQSINEIISCTLCAKEDFSDHYNISCLNRTCSTCGVKWFQQMAEEKSEEIVEWERFEYVSIGTKGNQTRKKLMLVKKKSSIAKLFTYFIELLSVFPAHQFRSVWQNQQLKALTTTLPQNDCVVVHDFSENYRVAAKEELQSAYFQRTEVTIHISILYRHAMLELDGIDSTEAKPEIVAEQSITSSDDDKHDHHFVHSVQQLIQEYLLSLNYKVNTMHEFTDGCQAQYKSRNCMGDISYACSDFRYQRVIRNFFETSHAKGPQDAAGGYIKRQFDLAILRGKARLQDAEECYNYACENLSSTQKSSTTSRRIFRYIKDVDRSRNRSFKPVKGNRSIHQIMSTDDGVLTVSDLSCYSCNNCSADLYDECLDKTRRCPREVITEVTENTQEDEVDQPFEMKDLVKKGSLVAIYTDDPDQDYYLLKASQGCEVLQHAVKDCWGSEFRKECEVIRGFYYQKSKTKIQFKLVQNRPAIISINSMLCTIDSVKANACLSLPQHVHEDLVGLVEECLV